MLATLVSEPFNEPGWVYEEKYDGIRILAYKEGSKVTLLSRNHFGYQQPVSVVEAPFRSQCLTCFGTAISSRNSSSALRSETNFELIASSSRLVFPTSQGNPMGNSLLVSCKRIAKRAGLACGTCPTCIKSGQCEHW